MLPIILTPTSAIGLAGAGEGLLRRQSLLAEAGVSPVSIAPDGDLSGLRLLFVAGLDPDTARALAERARHAGILTNVEDVPELCDFHVPAILRRGELLFTVSTGGSAPGLARRLREWLEQRFGPQWQDWSAELGAERRRWRGEGASAADIADRTRQIIAEKGWL